VNPSVVLPFLAAVLSFVFAAMVGDQWLRRRQPYQLVWTIGLVFYGVAAGVDCLAAAGGWNGGLYRTWYLFGAFGGAAYLGLGTIFLLNRTRFGYFVAFLLAGSGLIALAFALARLKEGAAIPAWGIAAVVGGSLLLAIVTAVATRSDRGLVAPIVAVALAIASAAAVVMTVTVPVAAPGYAINGTTSAPVGDAFPAYLRMLVLPFNITGGLALVFGAVFSAYIFMPKRRVLRVTNAIPVVSQIGRAVAVTVNFVASVPGAVSALRAGSLNSRVPATVLIAIGGLIQSVTSGLTRFGITWGYYLGELLGVLLIFLGFLVSIEVFSDIRLPFTHIVLVRRKEPEPSDGASA
jgi:riboflavin transporter FmnP